MHKLSIEKNGTGMKCSVNLIEKNGTGMSLIEKNGTGVSFIEKNGTGVRRIGLICSLFLFFGLMNVAMASQWDAHIVKQGDSIAISFNDGKQELLGVGVQENGYAIVPIHNVRSEGNGTGFAKSEGNGTGFAKSEGNGTGYRAKSEGNGTGYKARSEGNGTGYQSRSEGNGTGQRLMTVFGYAEIALNGDTASVLIYKDNARSGLTEFAALELPVFEQ